MIKLSANVSKKLPVPDVEFSSRSYSAGMEIEVSSSADAEELKGKLRRLYSLLEDSIEEQIGGLHVRGSEEENAQPSRATSSSGRNRSSSGNTNGRPATEAQIKAIHAIARDRNYSDSRLDKLISGRFEAKELDALSVSDASSLIDLLKNDGKD